MGRRSSARGFSVIEVILVVAIVVVLGVAGYLFYKHHHKTPVTTPKPVTTKQTSAICGTDAQTIKRQQNNYAQGCHFSGLVTANGCTSPGLPIGDVGCSIKVGNATVDVVHGNIYVTKPWGTLNLTNTHVGARVLVYAHQLDVNSFTLEGSTNYYFKAAN
ncbi:MAG TPA: prepilin-type N-terminal cleavage/methylation domain-containing protein [Candidatus Saccharimonadales bacterium]|nr:prepilin-type N-terminal cleavage/methylation domain-containing protein [Candidatus Saccharimonadales bacterium]